MVVSVAGAFNFGRPVKKSSGPPLHISHGKHDSVIPAVLSRQAYEVLKHRTGTVYKEYEDADHSLVLTHYHELFDDIYKWIFSMWDKKDENNNAKEAG
jgi:predicted esterase